MIPDFLNKRIVTGITSVIFGAVLIWWLAGSHYPADVVERVAGMDNRPKIEPRPDIVVIGEFFDTINLPDENEYAYGHWPHFRGPFFDNINHDTIPLAESWDSTGPPLAWKLTLGEGYAGPAVYDGKVYVMDYNERRKADMLRCFSLKSGTELWRRWYYVDVKRNHGYSRTVPSVTDKYIVTIGPRSHVMCMDRQSGDLLWTLDMEKEFGIAGTTKGKVTPDWYTGQCPLIDNDVAILAPGGRALMIGVDCATGDELWRTPNRDSLRMSHGSIMPMVLHGKKMYVYNAIGGVCGVSADNADRGKLLWLTKEWNPATTAASPLFLGNNEIAVFGAYGAGGARLRVNYDGSSFSAEVVEMHKPMDGIASDQHTPIITGDLVWSVLPENAGALKKQLVCYNISDLTTPVWTSGKEYRFGRGLGPYIVSGDRLFLLDDDAVLYIFKLEASGASLTATYKILDGIEAWAPMALTGNYLIMRDSRTMVALFVGKENQL
ncbi:MAG TPA: PQQ-binding-like beta-propeller repeat protein [Bacteroidales bacterium]|nr:PQQ-binding-like beta-propeller repeat protein [Bacteroidales bacterium]HPF04086.1 PQQ-binding-like beta-propeller repeat protein [Bacteroidales bacterium]HPJ59017.1 PQQ-binding-like beta-propeller repeat protein [Bacteroidales bacterium]HPR11166.1 PQQ-binding-like beta-propeller repeat protein [Bacteroidales bacterium]HRW86048.1 PQQ-binding-like beta-propeller repeat protein [Bacteroidales bacterium]